MSTEEMNEPKEFKCPLCEQEVKEEKVINAGHVIKLKFPVSWKPQEADIDHLVIERRMKTKDFKGISTDNIKFDHMARFASAITGKSQAFIGELDAADFFQIVNVIKSFLPDSQKPGEDS